MDSDAIGQLGGLALGEVLSQLDLDRDALSAVQNQLGLGGAAFSRESIYNDQFEEDQHQDDTRTDYETIINNEMEKEKYQAQGQASINKSAGLARGEEDDFDEDDDEEGDGVGGAGAGAGAGADGMVIVPAASVMAVQAKREASEDYDEDDEEDEGDGLFGDGDDDDQDAEGAVPAAEPAPAEDGPGAVAPSPDYEPIAAPPPMKQADVKDLFPRFNKGKTLDFTELFSTRPRKRPKKADAALQRKPHPVRHSESTWLTRTDPLRAETPAVELPTLEEVGRAKSTRDLLVQPMKPLPPRTGLRALLVSAQEREREEWEDEGSSDEELIKAIEVSIRISFTKQIHCVLTIVWFLSAQTSNRLVKSKISIPDDPDETFANAEVDRWEDSIIWGPGYQPPLQGNADAFVHRNIEFDRGDWVKSIIWDKNKPYKDFTKLNLNLNDTEMILEVQEPTKPGTFADAPFVVPLLSSMAD